MKDSYAILGAGMQGTAAGYDLAKFAEPSALIMADYDLEQARRSAERINRLVGQEIATAAYVNVLEPESLASLLEQVDVAVSCVPYWMHPRIAAVALETITDMVDLGGNTDVTWQTLGLDEQAKEAGITFVPDTGLAPGLVNSVGLAMIEAMDETEAVRLFCGVLPQNPKPPFNYMLTFNMEGLVTEYDYEAVVLRDGKVSKVPTLAELERQYIDQMGEMEAFTTSGGTSTAPYTFEGRLKDYEYKTLRFPGHAQLMRLFKDHGFWGEQPVDVKGCQVSPKDVFNTVFGPELEKLKEHDQCAVRGIARGTKDGCPIHMQVDIYDRTDPETGFSSMERLTGFSTSIIAQHVAEGNVEKGAIRYENAMSGQLFLEELRRRGISIRIRETIER
jgi:lysine 6-dehydrogenase